MLKKVFWCVGIVFLCPVVLFVILAILLYIPSVQNWTVQKVAAYASENTGMDISVEHVSLVFPLDLGVDGFRITQRNDSLPQVRDTVADVHKLIVDIQLKPLFSKKVVINALEFNKTKINTAGFISSARVKGEVGRLFVSSPGIDLGRQTVDIGKALLDDARVDVALSDTAAQDTATAPNFWKIHIDKVNIARTGVSVHTPGDTLRIKAWLGAVDASDGVVDLGRGLYTVASVEWKDGALDYDNNFEPRVKGLDFNHIALSGVNIGIDSIYYSSPVTKLNLHYCRLKEKSGIEIAQLEGPVMLDSAKISIPALRLRTPDSELEARLSMDMDATAEVNPGKLYLRLFAKLGKQDLMRFAGGLPEQFVRRYPNRPLTVRGSVGGNMRRLDFTGLDISLPTAFRITAEGNATDVADMERLQADVRLKARTYDMGFVTALLGSGALDAYRIPSGITVAGRIKAAGSRYSAMLTAREGKGNVKLDGRIDSRTMDYQAALSVRDLNLHHFMPKDSLYAFSGDIDVKGCGFDFFSKRSRLTAKAEIKSFRYGHWDIDKVNAVATLADGVVNASVDSRNALVDGRVGFDGLLAKNNVKATIVTDISKVDLYRIRLVDKPLTAGVCAHVDIASDMRQYYKVLGFVNDLTVSGDAKTYRPANITMDVLTSRDTTWAKVNSGNLEMFMAASGGYERLMKQGQSLADEITRQTKNKIIDQTALRGLLPLVRMRIVSGNDNPFANFLRAKGFGFDDFLIDLNSSPSAGLEGDMHLYSLVADSTRIDTVNFHISQDTLMQVRFNGRVRNAKNNPQFVFNTLLDGYVFDRGAGIDIRYFDGADKLGVSLGARAEMCDSGINVRLLPDRPVLGYKEFNLNKDNFVFLGRDKKVRARVDLVADDGTGVKVYSEDSDPAMLQDITVSLNKFDLEKITSVMPYAPRVSGLLNGDFRVMQNPEEKLSMLSDMSVTGMVYEDNPMGNLSTEFVYLQKDGESHFVEARFNRNDDEIGLLSGTYTAAGDGYLDATFTMNRFPLSMANGFVPDRLLGVWGYGDGSMAIKGPLGKPQVDGEVLLDSAYIASVPYGVNLRLDNDPVRIVGSNLLFENFTMYSYNDNPLNISGNVNFSDLDRITLDMKMRARDYQIINARKTRGSVAYGKAFVNFFGNLNGELDDLRMRGRLDVLGSTDMTYILKDSPLSSDDRLKDLVTFTDFRDTAVVKVSRPSIGGLDMQLAMNIESGARIMCALNADQSNYVNLEGGGELRMVYNPVDNLQLFGRYTLTEGEMKYALPIIPLKTFSIQKGSYIEFTGDVMNPRLDLTATEQVKSPVSSASGGSRTVLFDCGVRVTKTLADMGLEFTLDAPEDMTVKNELAAMSVEQRGKLAVTMLTTGMYLVDGNAGVGKFSMNSALNSFLQSQINSITNTAMRSIDLSVGLDQSSDATGNTHTDYSFKFAKRFWNNRVNLMIGGKISGGSENSAMGNQDETFIDNVSLEYRLDQTAMRYVRLFYNKNADDLLEGRISEYGAGLVWRKKMDRLGELFDLRGKKRKPSAPAGMKTDSVKPNEKKR